MALNIALLSRGILVFGIVGHSRRTKTHNLLLTTWSIILPGLWALAIFYEHSVKLLFWPMRPANRL